MSRPTIASMIVEDLKYCCPFAFFRLYPKTGLVAARLGVTPRAIQYFKEKPRQCQACQGCLKSRLPSEID